jgi:hypothetical protein
MTPQMTNTPRKTRSRAKKAPASNAELPAITDVLKSMKDILREDGLLPNPNWH